MTTAQSVIRQPYDFTEQFESGVFSDCRVKCEGRTWKLHRVILCARSKFFEGAFNHGFQESVNNEIVLEEQDPGDVDKVLRYIYSLNLSHVDQSFADDPNGMKLVVYKDCMPLYILGDFLGLPSLCSELLSRFHRANRRLAAFLQRQVAGLDVNNNDPRSPRPSPAAPFVLSEEFKADFTACVQQAYSIPVPGGPTEEELETSLPGGVRNIIIQLYEFTRFRPLDNMLLDALTVPVPELLVDIIKSMRAFRGGLLSARDWDLTEVCRQGVCVDCRVNPLTGRGEEMDRDQNRRLAEELSHHGPQQQPRSFFAGSGASRTVGANFWVREALCFECSVHYPRRAILCIPARTQTQTQRMGVSTNLSHRTR